MTFLFNNNRNKCTYQKKKLLTLFTKFFALTISTIPCSTRGSYPLCTWKMNLFIWRITIITTNHVLIRNLVTWLPTLTVQVLNILFIFLFALHRTSMQLRYNMFTPKAYANIYLSVLKVNVCFHFTHTYPFGRPSYKITFLNVKQPQLQLTLSKISMVCTQLSIYIKARIWNTKHFSGLRIPVCIRTFHFYASNPTTLAPTEPIQWPSHV